MQDVNIIIIAIIVLQYQPSLSLSLLVIVEPERHWLKRKLERRIGNFSLKYKLADI